MTASTNPQEILDVDNWHSQNPGLTGAALTDAAQQQGFDVAFIALVNFPQVLEMMAQHIYDYAAIGAGILRQPSPGHRFHSAIARTGVRPDFCRATPSRPSKCSRHRDRRFTSFSPQRVIHVPQYDPSVVYVRPSSGMVAAPLITFGAGIGIGVLLASNQPWGMGGWGWNWGARRAYYNHVAWGGWARPYRPPSIWYRPRPDRLGASSRLRWQLGLPPAELSSAASGEPPGI
jgi:hypothetical protein